MKNYKLKGMGFILFLALLPLFNIPLFLLIVISFIILGLMDNERITDLTCYDADNYLVFRFVRYINLSILGMFKIYKSKEVEVLKLLDETLDNNKVMDIDYYPYTTKLSFDSFDVVIRTADYKYELDAISYVAVCPTIPLTPSIQNKVIKLLTEYNKKYNSRVEDRQLKEINDIINKNKDKKL